MAKYLFHYGLRESLAHAFCGLQGAEREIEADVESERDVLLGHGFEQRHWCVWGTGGRCGLKGCDSEDEEEVI